AFQDVLLGTSTNVLVAEATKPSTNKGRLGPCEVTVAPNPPPSVTWVTPVSTSRLTAAATTGGVAIPDANEGAEGWQGTLRVSTNINPADHPGATVQFTANGVALEDPVI